MTVLIASIAPYAPYLLLAVVYLLGILSHKSGAVDLVLAVLKPSGAAGQLLKDVQNDVAIVKQTVTDLKAGGLTLADIQADLAAIKQTVADLQAAKNATAK